MAAPSSGYHEPPETLSADARDRHRAILSLIEELEAVDWYDQRAEVCSDPELRAILIHHRDEEIEHAMMALEWIRRRSPEFSAGAKTYLFSEGPITAVEEAATGDVAPQVAPEPASSLGIGKLKRS
jgi:hypothetical protein